jgi:hypothetical protein
VALLGALAVASVLAMFWVSLSPAPSYFEKLANAPDQRGALVDYNRGGGVWGIREFQPNYARLPALCPPEAERQAVSYNDVRRGVVAQKPYVVVTDGPIGFVSYTAPTGACRDDLVLGPLKPGDLVTVSERNVDWLFVARMVELALLAAVGLFLFLPRRRPA